MVSCKAAFFFPKYFLAGSSEENGAGLWVSALGAECEVLTSSLRDWIGLPLNQQQFLWSPNYLCPSGL